MGLGKLFKKNAGKLLGGTAFGLGGALIGDKTQKMFSGGGDGPVNFGFNDPNAIANEERKGLSDLFGRQRKEISSFQRKPSSLQSLLGDEAFGGNISFGGPAIENDDKAFDDALASAREQATFDERRGTENVLGGLQGRGLVKSGIALKDVVDQVLGPSFMRQNKLASDFGLERARRRSELLEGERAAQRQARLQQLSSRGAALREDLGGERDFESARFGGLMDLFGNEASEIGGIGRARLGGAVGERNLALTDSINQRRAMEERRQKRKSGLLGLLGGGVGGLIGSKFGDPGTGYQAGSDFGRSLA